jgi:hypothetical protein
MSNQLKPAPRARPASKLARSTDVQKVDYTRSLSTAIKASSHWPAAPDVQAAVGTWNTLADSFAANTASIAALRVQLHTLLKNQGVVRQQWGAATTHVLSTIDVFSNGDPAVVQSFGFDAVVRGASSASTAPTQITSTLGKLPGQATVRWIPSNRRGSIVQRATDVSNAATYSTPVVCTRRRYMLTGAQPASVVHVRVAAIDPSSPDGQSAWSEWISVTVR